jgi:hypothetical protein
MFGSELAALPRAEKGSPGIKCDATPAEMQQTVRDLLTLHAIIEQPASA